MQVGMVGLGKMGANMTKRLLDGGHQVVVADLSAAAVQAAVAEGATGATGVADLIQQLAAPRVVWLMIPAGDPTERMIEQCAGLLSAGDILIDGGNSLYKNAVRHAAALKPLGLHFVDVGTSGGIWGLKAGYSLMIGGEKDVVAYLRPIFETLAPAPDKGWGHVGAAGAGHYAKMIHNGIEYGMMQAFAEGFAILRKKDEFAFDLGEVARIWQDGSVVRSWLLDLIAAALQRDQQLERIAAYVPDSGEGRWTVAEAIDLNVAAPIITLSLQARIHSREDGYTEKLLSVMRNQFGGHAIKTEGE
ncbi:MAG: decarboxylating 6-phosphogluconate dehydrogenase [Anaerolineae bacterium]|jgi:6-phosphogluconate dehydrogenase|nr:decarboxylating 6-phosphogluconate dehydrogenase [Anaerolineae bacterium]